MRYTFTTTDPEEVEAVLASKKLISGLWEVEQRFREVWKYDRKVDDDGNFIEGIISNAETDAFYRAHQLLSRTMRDFVPNYDEILS